MNPCIVCTECQSSKGFPHNKLPKETAAIDQQIGNGGGIFKGSAAYCEYGHMLQYRTDSAQENIHRRCTWCQKDVVQIGSGLRPSAGFAVGDCVVFQTTEYEGGGYRGCIPFGVHPVPEPGRTRGDGLPDFPQQKDMYYTDWTHPFAEAEDIAEWHERINGERWQKQNFNETRYYNPATRPRPNDVGVVVAIGNQSQLPIPPGCTELDHDPCVEKPFFRNKIIQKFMENQLTPQKLQQQQDTHILVQWFPTNAAPGRNSVKNPSDNMARCHVCDMVCRNSNTLQCTECQHQTCKGCFGSGPDRTFAKPAPQQT